jgi:hypothetical protein
MIVDFNSFIRVMVALRCARGALSGAQHEAIQRPPPNARADAPARMARENTAKLRRVSSFLF